MDEEYIIYEFDIYSAEDNLSDIEPPENNDIEIDRYDSIPIYKYINNHDEHNAMKELRNYDGDMAKLIDCIFRNRMYHLILDYIHMGYDCDPILDKTIYISPIKNYYTISELLMKNIYKSILKSGKYNLQLDKCCINCNNIIYSANNYFVKSHIEKNCIQEYNITNLSIDHIKFCMKYNIKFKIYLGNLYKKFCKSSVEIIDFLKEYNLNSSIIYTQYKPEEYISSDDLLMAIILILIIKSSPIEADSFMSNSYNYFLNICYIYYKHTRKYKDEIISKAKKIVPRDYYNNVNIYNRFPEFINELK